MRFVGVTVMLASLLLAGCGVQLPTGQADAQLRSILDAHDVGPMVSTLHNDAQVRLGQALFFDKLLSGNRNISCATCHVPGAFTGDGIALSIGQGGIGSAQFRDPPVDADGNPIFIPRNALDLFNRGKFDRMLWDGRVERTGEGEFSTPAGEQILPGLDSALAALTLFPVTDRDEMRGHGGENELAAVADDDFRGIWSSILRRVMGIPAYVNMFEAAYPEAGASEVTYAHVGNAIAAFIEDSFTLTDSPFDKYLRGDDSAISLSVKRGATLFYGDAGCARCHSGTLMTDQQFHQVGVPQIGPGKGHGDDGEWDLGRGGITGDASEDFAFRTPPLRNVAATGPWMHDGAYSNFEDAVRHMLDPVTSAGDYSSLQLSPELRGMYQSEQTEVILSALSPSMSNTVSLDPDQFNDLVAFLESLTSPSLGSMGLDIVPDAVPSGLSLAD